MTQIVLVSRVNFFVIFLGAFEVVLTIFEQCNHAIPMQANQKIYINSPYYPAEYPLGTSCRYTVEAPLDYQLIFKCTVDINLKSTTPRCQSEVFSFNGEGNEILSESEHFCASTTFERKSFLNRAVISYISQPYLRRTLLPTTEESASSNEEQNRTEEDAIISTSSMTDLIAEENENAFTVLTKLLAANLTLKQREQQQTTSETTLMSSTSQLEENFTTENPGRTGKIVSSDLSSNDSLYFGYVGNRGGGRFSCLVEAIEPPCDCGWTVSFKIAGATGVAGVNEFPSMAGVKTLRYNKIFCGATIIHHRYLISAAHCFISQETNRADLISIVVGENDISTVLESFYTRNYEIEAIIPHEYFYTSSRTLRNDIALLRTRIPILWNRSVGPACLPFRPLNLPGTDVLQKQPLKGQRLDTVGWGTTSFGGAQSMQLLKTTLDIYPKEQCRKILRVIPSGVFCTFTPGHDACQYDSGGALYARTDRLFAVGIVSYGFACAATRPSVNTRIASFLKWIKAKTPEVNYCIK